MRNSKTQRRVGPRCARVGKRISALTVRCASVCIERVKWLAFLLLISFFVVATSCTTLVNRRDLYSPEPAPDSLEAARQWYGVTTTGTTTSIRTQRAAGEIGPPPDFRYYATVLSAERKIRLYSRHICVVDARCFAQPAFALGAFR